MTSPSFKPAALRPLGEELKRARNVPAKNREEAGETAKTAKKTPTYNLTDQQISDMKKQAAKEAVEVAWTLMLGLPCLPLMDKFGFTGEQLERYLDEVMDYYDSYEKGYITLKDVHDTVLEETGCDIIEKRVEARHKPHPKRVPYRRSKK